MSVEESSQVNIVSLDHQSFVLKECERQVQSYLSISRKDSKTMAEDLRNAHLDTEKAKIMANSHAREITKNLRKRHGFIGLICPICGEEDHGNKMNGKPVCMKNAKHDGLGSILLMTPEKAKDWKPPSKKFKSKTSWELDDNEIVRVK